MLSNTNPPLFFPYFCQNVKGVKNYINLGEKENLYSHFLESQKERPRIINLSSAFDKIELSNLEKNEAAFFRIEMKHLVDRGITELREVLSGFKDVRLLIEASMTDGLEKLGDFLEMLDAWGFDCYHFHRSFTIYKYGRNDLGIEKNDKTFYCIKKAASFSFIYFLHSSFPGGAERSSFDTTKNLISKYGAVAMAVMPRYGPMVQQYRDIGVPVLLLEYSWWAQNVTQSDLSNSVKNIMANKKEIEKINPDLVFTQTIVIPWGALVALMIKKPHIWNIREYGEKDHGISFVYKFADMLGIIEHFSIYITTCGKKLKDDLFPELGHERVGIAYTHIDWRANPGNRKCGQGPVSLIIPGTISTGKNQLEAVMSMAELIKRGKKNIRLTIIGIADNKKYLDEIKSFMRENDLDEYIAIKEFDPDIRKHLENSDVVLSCSKLEAQGRTIIEGMIFSKPIIASRAGEHTEIVIEGLSGLLYRPGDPVDLADKIEFLMDHPEEIQRMGENGCENIKKILSENYAEDTLYKAAMKFKGRKVKYDGEVMADLIDQLATPNFQKEQNVQTLFVDTGKGFNPHESIQAPFFFSSRHSYSISFDVKEFGNIESVRLDPSEKEWNRAKLIDVRYLTKAGKIGKIDLNEVISNGILQKDGFTLFPTSDPMFYLPVSGEIEKIEISGELEFLGKEELGKILREMIEKDTKGMLKRKIFRFLVKVRLMIKKIWRHRK